MTHREMALQSVCLIFEQENKGGKQNVKINNVYVEIKKSKNELSFRPCILVNFNG